MRSVSLLSNAPTITAFGPVDAACGFDYPTERATTVDALGATDAQQLPH